MILEFYIEVKIGILFVWFVGLSATKFSFHFTSSQSFDTPIYVNRSRTQQNTIATFKIVFLSKQRSVFLYTQRFMILDTSTNTNLDTPWNYQLSKINQLGFTRDSWQFHSGPIFYRFSFISSPMCVWDTNNSLYQSTSTPRT